jgi:protein-S-isoprenylcysteine O-methyltransferase Ste14
MFALARALVWAALFVAFGLVFIPARLLESTGVTPPPTTGPGQIVGIVLVLAGGVLVLACLVAFALVGKGTAAPFDPPRRLVERGPYRYIRNPIYVGALVALIGATSYYRSLGILGYALVLAVGFHILVLVYEEPTLRRLFGTEYEEYCRRVPRWFPARRRLPARARDS